MAIVKGPFISKHEGPHTGSAHAHEAARPRTVLKPGSRHRLTIRKPEKNRMPDISEFKSNFIRSWWSR